MIGCAVVGGSITTGCVIDTVGGCPFSVTIQVRSAVSRSDWPAVSVALAWARHLSSYGTVISYDHVVLRAPTTSGLTWKVLQMAETVPSSCR